MSNGLKDLHSSSSPLFFSYFLPPHSKHIFGCLFFTHFVQNFVASVLEWHKSPHTIHLPMPRDFKQLRQTETVDVPGAWQRTQVFLQSEQTGIVLKKCDERWRVGEFILMIIIMKMMMIWETFFCLTWNGGIKANNEDVLKK